VRDENGDVMPEQRAQWRRDGVVSMLLGMGVLAVGAFLSRGPEGLSAKANVTLLLAGAAGLVIIGVAPRTSDLARGDKIRIGFLALVSIVLLLAVDFESLLGGGGRIATPALVTITLGVRALLRGG
jgi:hypothetical protein